MGAAAPMVEGGHCRGIRNSPRRMQPVRPAGFILSVFHRQVRAHRHRRVIEHERGSAIAAACRPCLCASRRERRAEPRREGLEHAVGKSKHRNARHGHADRLGLYARWTDLPRFPRELCLRQFAILGAGRSLQAAGQLAGSLVQALEAVIVIRLLSARVASALVEPHIDVMKRRRSAGGQGNLREFGSDARPL